MAGGGSWTSQNKTRPGAYINFRSAPRQAMAVGDRGIATIMLPLSWGANDVLIDVYADELASGESLAKIGVTANNAKLLAGMLSWCELAKVYRGDVGGDKASVDTSGLTVTAKYAGTFGNSIIIVIVPDGLLFRVQTFVQGQLRDTQVVSQYSELENNDFVVFEGQAITPVPSAGLTLTGGTDGTFNEATRYEAYLNILSDSYWQVMAVTSTSNTIKKTVTEFIEEMRENQGRYVQAVMADYNVADYEGIISVFNGYGYIDGEQYTKEDACATVAGIMAGTPISNTAGRGVSNTGLVIPNANMIIGELKHNEIITALRAGHIVFTRNVGGDVKIEQDINTLNTFTADRNQEFRKNRIVRTLDEIGTSVRFMWEYTFMGRVNNDDDGRAAFRASIVSYLTDLQNAGVIQEFEGSDHVEVLPGNETDIVLANITVKPLQAMEYLYMTAVVRV